MDWRGQEEAGNPVNRLRHSSKIKMMVEFAGVVATDNFKSSEREERPECPRLHEYVQGESLQHWFH